jgi:hypothetical protein
MKRVVIIVGVLAALVVGVKVMADATQNRPDEVVAGTSSVVEFKVSTRDFQRGEPAAADALWAVCASTVGGDVSPRPEPVQGRWRVTISPAMGEHGEQRLVGCLQDLTIDRVVGRVTTVNTTR